MTFSLLIRHNHQLGCTRENNTREGCHRYKLYTTDGAVNCEYRDILQTIPRKHSCWFNDETTYVIKMKFHLFSISDSKYISFYVKVYFISKSETFFSGFFFFVGSRRGTTSRLSFTYIHTLFENNLSRILILQVLKDEIRDARIVYAETWLHYQYEVFNSHFKLQNISNI